MCGTAFAFVHVCELLAARAEHIALPPGSRAMETGGFKGRARERSRDALYAEIAERLGIPAGRIVNQYGMTELGSQFYDTVLADPAGPRRKLGPPWARVRLLDPATGDDVPPGEPGMITIVDLANTGSVLARADRGPRPRASPTASRCRAARPARRSAAARSRPTRCSGARVTTAADREGRRRA